MHLPEIHMKRPRSIANAIALAAMLLCLSASGQGRSSRLPISTGYSPDGVLSPWKISDVACGETGIVAEIMITAGQRVSAGDILATLDSTAVRMQLAIAESQAASTGREQSVRADVELKKKKVRAYRDARRGQYGSQSELERAEADLEVSKGRLLAELEEQEILRLQVARLRQQLKERTIVAPINGTIVDLHKEVGEFVAPNSPEVVRIVDVSRLRASFFLTVKEVRKLDQKDAVQVELSDGTLTIAKVEHIAPVADGESGLIEVRVLIDNPKNKIHGSRCTLSIPQGK